MPIASLNRFRIHQWNTKSKEPAQKNDYKEIQGLKLLHFLIDQSLRVPVKNGKPRYSLVVIIQQGGRCRPF